MLGVESTRPGSARPRRRAPARSARDRRAVRAARSTRTPWSRICRSASQQRVEILKALYRATPSVLILDEPTAVLTPQEAEELFGIMRVAARRRASPSSSSPTSCSEVLAIADRITVLRRGKVVGTAPPGRPPRRELAAMMVGRRCSCGGQGARPSRASRCSDVAAWSVLDDRGRVPWTTCRSTSAPGEIVGIAGVQGNGQTELVEALIGPAPAAWPGSITLGRRRHATPTRASVLRRGRRAHPRGPPEATGWS